jgi:lipoprotein-anchoring transpeptidase ErfK/SrfK
LKKTLLPTAALTVLLLAGCGTAAPELESAQAKALPSEPLHEAAPPVAQNWRDEQIDFQRVTLECDLSDQRVYVKQDGQIVRTMVTSSGLDTLPDNSTPRGEFQIEPERGEWFFSPAYQEGAMYWVSFQNHGEFLFHSVVMDQNQHILNFEAQKLGSKASHGCFRLPLADAKWIYDQIPVGTKVSIHE